MLYLKRFYRRINSLNQRLLLLFIIIALLPMLILGLINITATTRLIDEEVGARQQDVVRLIADKVGTFVNEVESHLSEAGRVWFKLELSPDDSEIFLQALSGQIGDYAALWITDASGQELVRFELGKAVARKDLKNLSEEERFFRPARGEPYFSTVRMIDLEPRLIIALPLVVDGMLVGTVGGQMRLNAPWEVIRDAAIGREGYAMLVDRRGNLIVHRDQQVMRQRRTLNLATLPTINAIVSGAMISPTLHYHSPIGGKVIGSAARIPGPDWVLVVERPETDAFNPVRQSTNRLIIALNVTAVVVVVLSIFFSRQITQPIIRLRNAANRVRSGDLAYRIPDYNHTEIGDLARAFNSMTASLNERIQEIAQKNQALTLATARAEEASRLKDEFLAVISHELRTPLHAIIGYTGIVLMDGDASPEGLEMLERVESNSQRLLLLINDLLDISRLEAKKMPVFPSKIAIRDLAQNWYDQMKVLAQDKKLTFRLHVADCVPETLISDEDGLAKIVINLLSNAIKFTHEGSVDLEIDGDANRLTLTVRDTGIGIPPEMHTAVFDRFRQVDSSSTRAYGGTGLGLAIVRSMCEAMHGSVTLDSRPGHGSTFTVWLPLPLQVNSNQDAAQHE